MRMLFFRFSVVLASPFFLFPLFLFYFSIEFRFFEKFIYEIQKKNKSFEIKNLRDGKKYSRKIL